MIPNLISTIFLIVGVPALILVMFLPALVELLSPRDRGPRMIIENPYEGAANSLIFGAVSNIEEESWIDLAILSRLVRAIEVLPCLEA